MENVARVEERMVSNGQRGALLFTNRFSYIFCYFLNAKDENNKKKTLCLKEKELTDFEHSIILRVKWDQSGAYTRFRLQHNLTVQ